MPEKEANDKKSISLITLEPGHFHSALLQKSMYPDVDSTVHVYAPQGDELNAHQKLIDQFNNRSEAPTSWNQTLYTGNDFFEKMLSEKAGNVVVLAGNNLKKTNYILRSVEGGFNVLADKPMAIDSGSFELLKKAFETAAAKNVLLYDIMTERYEISTILQRELSLLPGIFGELEKGTPENPAVTKESVHHFYKYVSGNVLTRPSWFFDVKQEGEGIVDVTTHLVDLIQWECFPDQVIDYKKDVEFNSARRWPTQLTLSQFKAITKKDSFSGFLAGNITDDSILSVFANGEINYKLRGVHAKASVKWVYKAPEGTSDTHSSIMRGTKANLVIRQGAEENYKPELYIETIGKKDSAIAELFKGLQSKYPGIELKENAKGWQVVIPAKYKEGHEAHFARVAEKFLGYLKNGDMPAWEVPNMIAKYYITTTALELAKKSK
ncbi:MAG: oxidoreductase [Gemmatimonadaceae bacterium]|nr:oxidoreductase [Chitinophagaceae bacterium]